MESLEDAFARQDREVLAKNQAKWKEIKLRAPELAAFLSLMAGGFGKLKLGEVEFKADNKSEKRK